MPKQDHNQFILDKLMEIGGDVASIKESSRNTESHLGKLNSKVATLESRVQVNEGTLNIHSGYITEQLDKKRAENGMFRSIWQEIYSKLAWLIISLIGIALYQFITHTINSAPSAIAR